jgi:hypothetical protein
MGIIDVKFIDVSDWQELTWLNSGGTRAKKILQSPQGDEYYFKCSEHKLAKNNQPEKHYKFEFWNEIIAYQLGRQMGLNMLRYDVAIFKNEIGCLSPKMNKTDDEQLIEVGRYMTALNPDFLPENNSARKEYTFQLLEETIEHFKLTDYWTNFFQTILFDAIISNTDRHQENWAFLGKTSFITEGYKHIEEEVQQKGFKSLNWFKKLLFRTTLDKDKKELAPEIKHFILAKTNINSFAPIYDSGSSLCRELTDDKIVQYLNDDVALEKYILNGKSELRWNDEKLNHFEFIKKLSESAYSKQFINSATFFKKFDNAFIGELLNVIDKEIPEKWSEYSIPSQRKELILKIVSLRFKKINEIVQW